MDQGRPSSEVDLELFEKIQRQQRTPIMPPEQVVALYIDVLGFKALIDQSESDWVRAVTMVQNIERWVGQFHDVNPSQSALGIVTRVFSDNIYISFPAEPSSKERIPMFLWCTGLLQYTLAQNGFFLRGGIAIGSQYATETTLFGTAVMRAYLCERQAKTPRILIDESFFSAMSECPYISIDSDGKRFLDYMMVFETQPSPQFVSDVLGLTEDRFSRIADVFVRTHNRQIVSGAQNAEDGSILEKYRWAAIYHNAHAKKEEDLIDMSQSHWKKFQDSKKEGRDSTA